MELEATFENFQDRISKSLEEIKLTTKVITKRQEDVRDELAKQTRLRDQKEEELRDVRLAIASATAPLVISLSEASRSVIEAAHRMIQEELDEAREELLKETQKLLLVAVRPPLADDLTEVGKAIQKKVAELCVAIKPLPVDPITPDKCPFRDRVDDVVVCFYASDLRQALMDRMNETNLNEVQCQLCTYHFKQVSRWPEFKFRTFRDNQQDAIVATVYRGF